jgi:hypothetical protein
MSHGINDNVVRRAPLAAVGPGGSATDGAGATQRIRADHADACRCQRAELTSELRSAAGECAAWLCDWLK